MSLLQILIGMVIMIGVVGLLMVALRPGRSGPLHFTDADSDGEPDADPSEKQAVIEADRKHRRELDNRR